MNIIKEFVDVMHKHIISQEICSILLITKTQLGLPWEQICNYFI